MKHELPEPELPIIYTAPTETPYYNKKDHLARSLANQPNHKKSRRVRGLMTEKEIKEYSELEFKTDETNLGC